MDVYAWLRRSMSGPKGINKPSSAAIGEAKKKQEDDDEEELFGITDRLINFIKTFSPDTFKSFQLQGEEEANCGKETAAISGNVRKDLSEWQERHATLVLSKVKEISQLRFRLCPRLMKERQFWRIYFTLVKGYLAEYELRAVQLDKLKQMTIRNDSVCSTRACEVEMSEKTEATNILPSDSLEYNLDLVAQHIRNGKE